MPVFRVVVLCLFVLAALFIAVAYAQDYSGDRHVGRLRATRPPATATPTATARVTLTPTTRPTATKTPPLPTPVIPTQTPTATAPSPSILCDIDPAEADFVGKLNAYRKEHGAQPLRFEAHLQAAAEWKAADLARYNYFSHDDRDGRNAWERIRDFGYDMRYPIGENIAAGYSTSGATLKGFQNSPHHDRNQLSTSFNAVGVALAYDSTSKYKYYWVVVFGGKVIKPCS